MNTNSLGRLRIIVGKYVYAITEHEDDGCTLVALWRSIVKAPLEWEQVDRSEATELEEKIAVSLMSIAGITESACVPPEIFNMVKDSDMGFGRN